MKHLRWTFFAILSGILAGTAAAIFLLALEVATQVREETPVLLWFLPIAGLLIGWIYHKYGKDVSPGTNLILDEIHNPRKVIPWTMTPLVLGSTILTHLFGGSAGREGTVVQMGASLSDQLSRFFKIENAELNFLLGGGAGAGFAAAIGAPGAGVIFGMEVIEIGRIKLFAWFECLIASFVAYETALFFKVSHFTAPPFEIPRLSVTGIFYVIVAGIAFGLTARVFSLLTHSLEKLEARFISFPPLRPFFGGLALLLFFYFVGPARYAGLGLPVISEAFQTPSSMTEPFFKMIATVLTIGSGFKGGEFVPLVFMGTTLGSALSLFLPLSFPLLAGLGFAAVFGAAAKTPIACTVMAIELFGMPIAPYAIIACGVSYFVSGRRGIYRSQFSGLKRTSRE